MTKFKSANGAVVALGLVGCASMISTAFAHGRLGRATHDRAGVLAALISGQKPFTGKERAPVKVVGFIDYECPACRIQFQQVEAKVAKTKNACLYIEQAPLPYHKLAKPAAILAVKAESKGIYPAVHLSLLKGHELSNETLKKVCKRFGIDDRATASNAATLTREYKAFNQLGIAQVPFFVVSDGKTLQFGNTKKTLELLR